MCNAYRQPESKCTSDRDRLFNRIDTARIAKTHEVKLSTLKHEVQKRPPFSHKTYGYTALGSLTEKLAEFQMMFIDLLDELYFNAEQYLCF